MSYQDFDENPKYSNLKPILKVEKTITSHTDGVTNISIFPSGNIVSVSFDKSIIIYNNNFEIIQKIENAHTSLIWDIQIKNEEIFSTCSSDNSIKIWKKKENKNEYEIKETIENAHSIISKILYQKNGNLISCSVDGTIKIWNEINNKNQCITILTHSERINSILLCEDKNILISSGENETKFWSLNNYKCIEIINDSWSDYANSLIRIDNDRIIVGGHSTEYLTVISINEKKIIKKVLCEFGCYGMGFDKEKGYLFVGGEDGIMFVYNVNNYDLIGLDSKAHSSDINGFMRLDNGKIISWGSDDKIKIWSYID